LIQGFSGIDWYKMERPLSFIRYFECGSRSFKSGTKHCSVPFLYKFPNMETLCYNESEVLMRINEVEEVEVDVFCFRGKSYEFLRVGLSHINFDKANNKRSDFSLEEVVELVIGEIQDKRFEPVGETDGAEFFVHFLKYNEKPYKLIFETREKAIFINVITLFRQRIGSK
jgi:hypothetical protein